MSETLLAALAYAQRGWAVLPLTPRGKAPLTPHGVHDASTDADVIRTWWGRWPLANVGISCGPSGLAVLDVDPRAGGDVTLGELVARHGPLPDAPQVVTGGGGCHVYFRAAPGLRSRRLGEGVEVKAAGGYVVAPPSVHPSGAAYAWAAGRPPEGLPDPPDWLAEPGQAERPEGDAPIPAGRRNVTLTSLAGTMRRRGMSEAAILAALLVENAARCHPPLPEPEVRRLVRSAARYPPEEAVAPAPGAVRVWDLPEPAPRRWLVPGLVPEGALSV